MYSRLSSVASVSWQLFVRGIEIVEVICQGKAVVLYGEKVVQILKYRGVAGHPIPGLGV